MRYRNDGLEYKMRCEIASQSQRIADLEAALREAKEVISLMDGDGVRAKAFVDMPEDWRVEFICEHYGYGAVIDAACRLWFRKDPDGSFVSGPCAMTVRKLRAKVDAALKN